MNLKAKQPIKIEKKRLLLVEGKDEIMFFDAFLKFLKLTNIQVLEVKGKEQFKNEIPKLKVMQGFPEVEKFGLIRDADTNFQATLQSVFDILESNSFKPIKEHNKFSNSDPKIGIFIMPGLNSKGSLEDLCLKAVDTNNQLNCSNDFINCVKKAQTKLNHVSKRKVLVYLASQKELCNNLGLGAQKKYWDFDSNVYDDIKKFIQDLSA